MDMPPGIFATELLDFYPHATVIVNRRRDMDAWHRSLNEASEMVLGSWTLWGLSWWDARLFWWYRSAVSWMGIMGDGDFQSNGRPWADGHYKRLEGKLKADGRTYLDREVHEGWDPLCAFLDKDVPEEDFPWGNKAGRRA